MSPPCAARLCPNCPFRKGSPKAGEPGGSVPAHDLGGMLRVSREVTGGMKVMQCHDSTDQDPRACAGYLSVVGYESVGVRIAVMLGVVRHEDVGRPIRGLYGSFAEMLREADHIHFPAAALDGPIPASFGPDSGKGLCFGHDPSKDLCFGPVPGSASIKRLPRDPNG